jgi:1-acyl-sn-glycerol-3-phosphate acyltransferase
MIRIVAVILWTVFITAVLGTVATITALFSRTGNVPHLVARAWARSIMIVGGIQVTVYGIENIPKGGPCIFMANHASQADIPALLAFLKVQFRWLAKAELFKIPILGRGMQGCGYISIDRSDRKSAFESLKKAAGTIRNGVSVMIFPEGTRSEDGRIREFKKGGFILALDAGVPIVPVVIHGTADILPKGSLRIHSLPVMLEIMEPIDVSAYSRKSKDDLIVRVRTVIEEHYYGQRMQKS